MSRERHPEWRGSGGSGKTLWACGHYVGTIALDEAKVRGVQTEAGGGGAGSSSGRLLGTPR